MIRLKASLMADLDDTLPGLKRALQNAIELEHSTIPPYLYALYSIKPGRNLETAGLVRSVVIEEMLHMALDCNVLNAIGGKPRIDFPKFIPTYPGHLPGAVESELLVPLAPISKQLVHDVFMVIEEPEDPQHYPVRKKGARSKAASDGTTIGQFYAGIKDQIERLSKKGNIFTGDPARQLRAGFTPLQRLNIHDAATACAAIDLIVEQGEGSAISPLDPEHELAHYYKYSEIFYGKKLVRNPDPVPGGPEWMYGGHSIAFDPCGVWPVIVNPSCNPYPVGSRVANLNNIFNYNYTNMLKSLHAVFNGEPDRLGPAIGLMEALKEQAQLLMSTELVPGQTAGPTFEYHPERPGRMS